MTNTEIEQVARAAAQASKFGTKALETTEKLASFAARVFREPAEAAVGMLGDRLKFMRWQRQVRLADRVNEILADRSVEETRAVPPKLALPIFEQASLEENDGLQDLWAKLLANAMDPGHTEEVRYAFVEIIRSLNPLDVRMLHSFYESLAEQGADWQAIKNYNVTREQMREFLGISPEDYELSVHNLFRVQCLTPAVLKTGATMGNDTLTINKGTDAVTMTPLGKSFVEACIR